jgi:hypothetical protein
MGSQLWNRKRPQCWSRSEGDRYGGAARKEMERSTYQTAHGKFYGATKSCNSAGRQWERALFFLSR